MAALVTRTELKPVALATATADARDLPEEKRLVRRAALFQALPTRLLRLAACRMSRRNWKHVCCSAWCWHLSEVLRCAWCVCPSALPCRYAVSWQQP